MGLFSSSRAVTHSTTVYDTDTQQQSIQDTGGDVIAITGSQGITLSDHGAIEAARDITHNVIGSNESIVRNAFGFAEDAAQQAFRFGDEQSRRSYQALDDNMQIVSDVLTRSLDAVTQNARESLGTARSTTERVLATFDDAQTGGGQRIMQIALVSVVALAVVMLASRG